MNTETRHEQFTQTRSTWFVLTIAGLLWVALCVWAVTSIGFVDGQRAAAEPDEAEARIRLALEREEDAKLQAQAEAAEQRHVATALEAFEGDVEREAILTAEIEEQGRLVAEQEAAEKEAAEKARLLAEANDSVDTVIDESARKAAAAEASRVAAVARQLRQYESLRERELRVLGDLSSQIRFEKGSAAVSRDKERLLDEIFNPLYLYSDLPVLISVAGNEYDGTPKDGLLSRDRGRAIASYLINRGLEKSRFRILIESGENLESGTHRVRVSVEEVLQ